MFTSSGSANSDKAVKPTKSQNSAVTTLRSSTAPRVGTTSEAPHIPHKRKPSGFS